MRSPPTLTPPQNLRRAPASFLGGGVPPPSTPPPPPGSNALTSMLIVIPTAVRMEAIIIPCSQNNIQIHSANDVSLSGTLAIVSLKLVIWLVSLPLRRLMLSYLIDRSSFSLSILCLVSSRIPSSYSGLPRIFSSLCFFFLSQCTPSSCWMRFSLLLDAFSMISWSSMSSTLTMSDIEGSFSLALFSATACQDVGPLGTVKRKF